MINKSTGVKFGKTEAGAIWLDPKLTSPFDFYQFWFNSDDESVKDYLKLYTTITKEEYINLMKDFDSDKSSRIAQRRLAYDVTKLVHGKEIADKVVDGTKILFGKTPYPELEEKDQALLKDILLTVEDKGEFLETIVESGLANSNTEASTFVKDGAIKVNSTKIDDPKNIFNNGYNLLQKGKNLFSLVVKK